MSISVLELFKVGIGPSSSHTVGPMKAARLFAQALADDGLLASVAQVRVDLYGSLAATGIGHATDKAVLLGLEGADPATVDPDHVQARPVEIAAARSLQLLGSQRIVFRMPEHLKFHKRESLPLHPNGMRCTAWDAAGAVLLERCYYSVGGGFVIDDSGPEPVRILDGGGEVPHPYRNAAELLAHCASTGLPISGVVLANELAHRSEAELRAALLHIWAVMQDCVQRGCRTEGLMPGRLKVRRRAADLYRALAGRPEAALRDPLTILDWVNLYALAVNEENASGGRVVTAPTNGAAGIIPAVLHYYHRFSPNPTDDGVVRFLLTAGAIGILYKENASISGAEVGCQGEVGVACSMAAGALTEVMGGTVAQVENAAEIGMEHNLGLTCDPVAGLVQVPCIERNAMGSMKAINACRLALRGDGQHFVSLDKVIKTMRITGRDMKTKYKETSRGGLAVNVIEC